jgi:hypothetical protein
MYANVKLNRYVRIMKNISEWIFSDNKMQRLGSHTERKVA